MNEPQMTEKPYTPQFIADGNVCFEIPIYQRLFVWGEEQINQLLDDLYRQFKTAPEKPYYIGAITVLANGKTGEADEIWEVVDGQQRLTFLMLFGACAGVAGVATNAKWGDFLKTSRESRRIEYTGRRDDQNCLYGLASKTSLDDGGVLKNPNMERFRVCFSAFAKKAEADFSEFSKFVFEKTAFLVSFLPVYSPDELNQIFEKMNASGRQLEQDEIVKGMFFADQAGKWNQALSVRCEAAPETDKAEAQQELSLCKILSSTWAELGFKEPAENKEESEKPPHSLLISKSVMLLHVLAITGLQGEPAEKEKWGAVAKTEPRHLVQTFKDIMSSIQKEKFIENLTMYRAWINGNIIFKFDRDEMDFLQNGGDNFVDDMPGDASCMRQFQSFLVVSSDNKQSWMYEAYCQTEWGTVSLTMEALKSQDNARHPFSNETALSYNNGINRYWFWRLDYYLWEKRGELSLDKEEAQTVAGFCFRANRSIEHLHPQSEKNVTAWSYEAMHGFGNLAMISSSFNSAQSDDGVATKLGRLKDQKSGPKLESIKLLMMSKAAKNVAEGWTEGVAEQHGKAMIAVLKDSFG